MKDISQERNPSAVGSRQSLRVVKEVVEIMSLFPRESVEVSKRSRKNVLLNGNNVSHHKLKCSSTRMGRWARLSGWRVEQKVELPFPRSVEEIKKIEVFWHYHLKFFIFQFLIGFCKRAVGQSVRSCSQSVSQRGSCFRGWCWIVFFMNQPFFHKVDESGFASFPVVFPRACTHSCFRVLLGWLLVAHTTRKHVCKHKQNESQRQVLNLARNGEQQRVQNVSQGMQTVFLDIVKSEEDWISRAHGTKKSSTTLLERHGDRKTASGQWTGQKFVWTQFQSHHCH